MIKSKKLLLPQQTFDRFGYWPADLSFGSIKVVIHKCGICGKEKETKYVLFLQEKSLLHQKCKINKTRETNIQKYGVGHPAQSSKIQEKIRRTTMERYGVERSLSCPEIKNKIKRTLLKRYGVAHPSFSKEIREKAQQTLMRKYNVEHPLQSQEIKEKARQTNLKKYGVEWATQSKEKIKKTKQIFLEKYGVENPLQSPKIRKKIRQTCLKRYGVENPSQSQKIKEKKKQTSLSNYGVEYHNQQNWKIEGFDGTSREMILEYIKREMAKEGYRVLSKEYINGYTQKLEVECPKGHQYGVRWSCLEKKKTTGGNRCPVCKILRRERELGEILEQLYAGRVRHHDNLGFLGRQSVDYSIKDSNLVFEYDGIQHFKPNMFASSSKTEEEAKEKFRYQKKLDKRKNALCKKNGYVLIRIGYDEKLNLQNIQSRIEAKWKK